MKIGLDITLQLTSACISFSAGAADRFQAHYPPERDQDGRIDGLADEDQEAVHQLFKLLYRYSMEIQPSMQIIVTDHVELLDDWFRQSIAERLRDGIALVPRSWLRD